MGTKRNPVEAVRSASQSEQAAAADVVVLAFSGDPIARWIYPDPNHYLQHFPVFVQEFGGGAFAAGSAYVYLVGEVRGAALWLPPGVHPDDEALERLTEQTVPEPLLGELKSVLGQMADSHPAEPHWYLPLIGVDPAAQGKGYGGRLMEYALDICDRDGVAAYLESSNPANISLYRRHGFEVMSEIQVGSSPSVFPMLRSAR